MRHVTGNQPRPDRRILICCYLACMLLHLPLIVNPPAAFYYGIDEQHLTFAAVDRLIGIPSTTLQWPATPLQLLVLPVYLAGFLFSYGVPFNQADLLERLGGYLAHIYEYPESYVSVLRIVSLAINSFAPIFVYLIVIRLTNAMRFAAVCAVLFTLQPLFFRLSAIALGDAASVTFALAAIAVLLSPASSRTLYLSGFLFATALACKITIAGVIFLPLVYLLLTNRAGISRFLTSMILGFVFWNPYIWTDPLRYAKATAGNAMKQGAAFSVPAFSVRWLDAMGITFTVLSCIVLIAAVSRRRTPILIAAFVSLIAVALPILLGATTAETRYLIPVLPCLLVMATACWTAISPKLLATCALLATFGAGTELVIEERRLRQPDPLMESVRFASTLPPSTALYIPEEAFETLRIHPSRATLDRILTTVQPRLQDDSKTIAYYERRHLPARATRAFVQALNDREQAALAHLKLRALHAPENARELFIYTSDFADVLATNRMPSNTVSVAEMDEDTAIARARQQKNTAILLLSLHPELGQPAFQGATTWHWYRF